MILVATQSELLTVDEARGGVHGSDGLADARPTCLTADPWTPRRAWCGTRRHGVFRSDDSGRSWHFVGLDGHHITALTASPTEGDVIWAGTEPSRVFRSGDAGASWQRTGELERLPSSSGWSFPPRPDTHHVRWIVAHPHRADRLWVAIEAGALISTGDAGRSWRDRTTGGPLDTHEAAVHPDAPERLRVAAGDGYFESPDGGATWEKPRAGLEVGYLRSITVDPDRPDVLVISAASRAHAAYVAGASDGRVYRREGAGRWERVVDGWPDPPDTIAPLLRPGAQAGELWAADERGVHRSADAGASWRRITAFPSTPNNLRGLARVE